MKTLKLIVISLLLVAFCGSSVLAVEGGNSRKGKYLYKKNCKTCHAADADGGELTPLSKTQKQWDRFFTNDKHKKNPDAWGKFSEKDIQDVNQFLYDHAVDSDQPETCG